MASKLISESDVERAVLGWFAAVRDVVPPKLRSGGIRAKGPVRESEGSQ